MLLHKWENVLIFLFFLPLLFILFIVIFPYLWSLAFYFVKFLEIKNIYKILIIFSILNLILFSAYYAYYFTEIGWLFGPLFAAGLVAVPFYLWKLYKAEKEEKDNALIQRMPTLQDYFNKNKKRFITNKKMFFIGLFSVFISIWQIEVPQRLVFKIFTTLQPYPKYEIMPLEVKNDTNASFVDKVSSFRLKNMDKKLPCGLISFYCNIRSIYYSDENIKDFELVKIYGAYFARSTLFNALTIYDASAYEYYGNSDFDKIKKLINKQGESNVTK